jgi:hypothetical protein
MIIVEHCHGVSTEATVSLSCKKTYAMRYEYMRSAFAVSAPERILCRKREKKEREGKRLMRGRKGI